MDAVRPSDSWTRSFLALAIVGLSIIGITVASAIAIGFATSESRPEMARLVFSSVLPLFGTWVGTVLAFYFARENLQAATESTLRLSGLVGAATPVAQVMIPRAQIVSYNVPACADPNATLLRDLQTKMTVSGKGRVPIFDSSAKALYVIHQSTLDAFAKAHAGSLDDRTLGDLLGVAELNQLVEALAFVAPDAVLADARAAMRAVTNCNDVFVTTNGAKDGPVMGWLTNTLLAGVT